MKKIIFLLLCFCREFCICTKSFSSRQRLVARRTYRLLAQQNRRRVVDSFALAPEFGYDTIRSGAWPVFSASTTRKVGGTSANVFVIEPYARYKYFNKGSFTLFVDGGLGVAVGDSDGVKVGFTPG